jgi:hypothetical protein
MPIMNRSNTLLLALGLAHALLSAAHAQTDTSLPLIANLAQLNGQALACQDLKTAGQVKKLMIAHAPKTAQVGSHFEEGTQQSYLAQLSSPVGCPDAATLATRLNAVAQQLQTSLPAQVPAATSNTPAGQQQP